MLRTLMLSMLLVLAAPTALATQPEVPVAVQGIPPAEEITLTGSIEEPITVKIGAQTIEVDMLPFKFWLKQEQIPLYIEITSPNYVYQRIYVKKYTKEDYKIARQTEEEVERTYVVDTAFAWSDHNPVAMTFSLACTPGEN